MESHAALIPRLKLLFLLISPSLTTCTTLSPFDLSAQTLVPLPAVQPSPWWSIERFGQNLIENAQSETATRRLNITVNDGVWATWDYLKRYTLMQNLGRVAINQDYSLHILGSRKNQLASYIKVNGAWQMQPPSLGATPYRYEAKPQSQLQP